MELCANLLKKLNTTAVISNFLAFFLFLFEQFSLLDPDPQPWCLCKSQNTWLRLWARLSMKLIPSVVPTLWDCHGNFNHFHSHSVDDNRYSLLVSIKYRSSCTVWGTQPFSSYRDNYSSFPYKAKAASPHWTTLIPFCMELRQSMVRTCIEIRPPTILSVWC